MTMPNFLIIGAGKAGTTSLNNYLKQHPQIFMSPIKETNFFALEGEKPKIGGPGDREARQNRYSITDIETYRANFQKGFLNEKAIGEACPFYLYSPKAPERIKHYIPNVKMIAILRNPVDRAYSHFLHLVREGREPLTDFAQAMREEETRICNNWAPTWHIKQNGFYYEQLSRYFDRFDKAQLRIYLYEDFKANPVGLLQNIFHFLDVDQTFVPDMSTKYNQSLVPRNRSLNYFLTKPNPIKAFLKYFLPKELRKSLVTNFKKQNLVKSAELSPEVRKELIQVYRQDILKLQELIKRDLSKWLE